MRLSRRRLLGAGLLAGIAAAWAPEATAQPGATESAVKAAFLFKFASFVEWPPSAFPRADDALVIGVAGDEAVAQDLEQLVAGRSYDGRAVRVRRVRDPDDGAGIHMLLVGPGHDARVREFIAAVRGPVLVVTEQENGLRLGGVLNFLSDGGRVRFGASVPAAEARSLRLSARLLGVAATVEGRGR
ncbi:YfiR/HmsC family protein [Ramlibacter algicola]|uniref:YfiR family protein n=1 Tax=Ramlibacter algicola TaxID=2795217 RepID=A0A934PZ09_9BURK|nr:YfiR family protein [Ramlibacter algicola]